MTLPNFLYIGPPKSGSTWLYEILNQHPDIFVPTLKDLFFFDRHYERGLKWYGRQFDGSHSFHAIGEISHDYIYSREACDRIANDLPNAKLITLLREPTERAVSHYKYLSRFKKLSCRFEEAVRQSDEILDCGRYGHYLYPYYQRFPADRIGVFFFDDLKNDAAGLARSIFRFLGVDDSFDVDTASIVNAHAVSRSRLFAQVAKQSAHAARRLGWTGVLGRAKRSRTLRRMLFREVAADRQQFDLSGADEICAKFYAEDTERLCQFLPVVPPWVADAPRQACSAVTGS